jgi:hypothetical protein
MDQGSHAAGGQDSRHRRGLVELASHCSSSAASPASTTIIPKLKELFTLSYFEAMLVQSAFFAAYRVAAGCGAGRGYMRGAVAACC